MHAGGFSSLLPRTISSERNDTSTAEKKQILKPLPSNIFDV